MVYKGSGWTDGANAIIDYRWGSGDADPIRLHAAELTRIKARVIWTSGALPLLALKRATRKIPVVFTHVYDPVGSEFAASLTRPGGNITGFTLGETPAATGTYGQPLIAFSH